MPICSECDQRCRAVEVTWDFAGTHCTGGVSGTHHTGHYVSSCCGAEMYVEDFPPSSDEED